MKTDNTQLAVQELISYSIVSDKQGVVNLLRRNGIKLPSNPSNADVTMALLVANKKSAMFKNELAKYLTDKVKDAGETFSNIVGNSQDFGFTGVDDVTYMPNFTGIDDFNSFTGWDDYNCFTGLGDFKNALGDLSPSTIKGINTAVDKKKQADAKKTGTTVGNFFRWINTNVITKDNVNAAVQYGLAKQNQKLAEKDNALAEQSLILQQQQADMTNKGVKPGITGTTILYISVGVIALVGIGFLIYKSKKK
jgi:hypothetical protein